MCKEYNLQSDRFLVNCLTIRLRARDNYYEHFLGESRLFSYGAGIGEAGFSRCSDPQGTQLQGTTGAELACKRG